MVAGPRGQISVHALEHVILGQRQGKGVAQIQNPRMMGNPAREVHLQWKNALRWNVQV